MVRSAYSRELVQFFYVLFCLLLLLPFLLLLFCFSSFAARTGKLPYIGEVVVYLSVPVLLFVAASLFPFFPYSTLLLVTLRPHGCLLATRQDPCCAL